MLEKLVYVQCKCKYQEVIHKGRPREGGRQMRTPVLILPVKSQILRTWGGGVVKNVKILRTSFMDGPLPLHDCMMILI